MEPWTQPVRRARVHRRYTCAGAPNVAIDLRTPMGMAQTIYISLDQPARFVQELGEALGLAATGSSSALTF